MAENDRTILVVEDNPDDELLTLRALRQNGIANNIVVARDGAEALDYLLPQEGERGVRHNEVPQVMLLDLGLPKVGGLEVLERVRAEPRLRHLPVVVLTSSDEQRDLIESYELGANSYVRKPVVFDEFLEAVRQLGMYWMLINQIPTAMRA